VAKWKKWGLAGLGLIMVLGIMAQSALKKVEADLAPVKKADVAATVTEKGRIISRDAGDIFSEVQGKVKRVYVDAGDPVKKGTLLAELDTGDIEQQISRLEGELKAVSGQEEAAQLQGSGSQIRQQQLAVEQARVALSQATSDYNRTRQLYNEGAATAVELEQAGTGLETARKSLAQAEAALTAAKKQSKGNKTNYQGQRESLTAQLNYLQKQKAGARIAAGRDGVVFAKKVREGDMVAPGALLFTVGSLGRVNIEIYVNSNDMANIKQGDEVAVTFKEPGGDRETAGAIAKISPVTEERMSPLGIIEDKIKVTAELRERPAGISLTPGRTVDVSLITRQAKGVPAVPKDAVFTDNGQDFIWVVKKGTASLVRVVKGIEGDELVEIKSGVTVGEEVINDPHQTNLKEGVRVKQRINTKTTSQDMPWDVVF